MKLFLPRDVESYLLYLHQALQKILKEFLWFCSDSRTKRYVSINVRGSVCDCPLGIALPPTQNDDFDYSGAPFRKMRSGFIGPVGRW